MFDKLKQLKELKQMKDSMGEERFEVEKQGTKVVLDGNLSIVNIVLDSELDKQGQESVLKECFNEAVKKVQTAMVQKFKGFM